MTKQEIAVEIASALFGTRVLSDNWKVRDLVKLKKDVLLDLYKMAEKADPKFGVRERCPECRSEPCFCNDLAYDGWTRKQLNDAFTRVQNPGDWKAPIRSKIERNDMDVSRAAIWFFTSTAAVVHDIEGEDAVLILAEGYRAGPAGDH